eukprot:NODE_6644_length_830_cov_48.458274_g6408_i0.p1 GENE.NODE_6644_length_830_cov_48.458274_g6408_i0~~NODE_6644_length_830_cov_48.458274_g6408_i0.p1  ORF type:complete len:180 (+),score=14.99 NODE_6644_length_830_cov_48.458274_g6408_i0:87-626(+)
MTLLRQIIYQLSTHIPASLKDDYEQESGTTSPDPGFAIDWWRTTRMATGSGLYFTPPMILWLHFLYQLLPHSDFSSILHTIYSIVNRALTQLILIELIRTASWEAALEKARNDGGDIAIFQLCYWSCVEFLGFALFKTPVHQRYWQLGGLVVDQIVFSYIAHRHLREMEEVKAQLNHRD